MNADEFLNSYRPSADAFLAQYDVTPVAQSNNSALSAFTTGAYSPFKPIVNNTIEAFKNAATNTGEAISNPNPNAPWLLQKIGQVGNAIQGTGEALFSPVTGAMTASAEATMPLQEKIIGGIMGVNKELTPEQRHQIAQEEGGWASSGIAAATGANAKTNMLARQNGTPPNTPLYDPLKPLFDKMTEMSANNQPRAGLMASNSSDPMLSPQYPTPAASEVRNAASQRFVTADMQGGMLRPEVANTWADTAIKLLPQSREAKTVFGGESPIDQMVQRIQDLRDKPMSLQGTLEIERGLGDLVENNVDPLTGKVNALGKQYLDLQHGLRDLWENATEKDTIGGNAGFTSAKEGRDLWAASARMNDIERIIKRAELTPNPATSIKTGMRNLLTNPERLRGFTPKEVSAINAAAKNGASGALLKLTTSRLVSPMIGGFIGGGVGAGLGSAIAEGSNAMLNRMQVNKAQNILDELFRRPAVHNAMPFSMGGAQ